MALFGTGAAGRYWRTSALDLPALGGRPLWVSVWTNAGPATGSGGYASFWNTAAGNANIGPNQSTTGIFLRDSNDAATNVGPSTAAGVLAANTWRNVLSYLPGASERYIFVAGVSVASNTTTLTGPQTLDRLTVGINGAAVLPATIPVAEVVFGTGLLSGEQIKALAGGRNPLVVAPRQVLAYFPLRGNLADLGPRQAGLQTSFILAGQTVWTEHPLVDPPPRRRLFFRAATTPPPVTARPRITMVL